MTTRMLLTSRRLLLFQVERCVDSHCYRISRQQQQHCYYNPSSCGRSCHFSSSASPAPGDPSTVKKAGRPFLRGAALGVAVITIPLLAVGVYVRDWRHEQFKDLENASDDERSPNTCNMKEYPVRDLIINMQRSGLMGHSVDGAKSVKEELEEIRRWHLERNFKGGLVLRDLEQPLFNGDAEENSVVGDPMGRARRECYFLYYERLPSAEIRQQVFCRGTELWMDVLTCLQAWYIYDEELDAHLHKGFRNHAERLITDLEPLLIKDDQRATIEMQGHSLGGVVATIVALKLQKRGYNVTRITTSASPRFCDKDAAIKLSKLLPEKTLRVEDDRDFVPLLPPFASHLTCDKLWFVQNDSPKFIPKSNLPEWVDSVWVNFRAPEISAVFARRHRVSCHVTEAEKIPQSTPR